MIYFVDYNMEKYVSLIADKFNHSIRTLYAPLGVTPKAIPVGDNITPPAEISAYFMNGDMEAFRYFYLQYLETYKPLLSIINLVLDEYYNDDVIVLTDLSVDYGCNVLECISTIINRRYGSNCVMINNADDMNNYIFDANTSKEVKPEICIQRFMNDKEWYYNQVINGKEKELLNSVDVMEEYSYGAMGK